MIELLPKMYLHGNRPSFYDSDSVTVLELSAEMRAKMNELIDDYNKFAEGVNVKIEEFITKQDADWETYKTAMRQEFQDFIDVINIKYDAQEARIDGKIGAVEDAINALIARLNAAENELLNAEY